jgi:hypothetical protein
MMAYHYSDIYVLHYMTTYINMMAYHYSDIYILHYMTTYIMMAYHYSNIYVLQYMTTYIMIAYHYSDICVLHYMTTYIVMADHYSERYVLHFMQPVMMIYTITVYYFALPDCRLHTIYTLFNMLQKTQNMYVETRQSYHIKNMSFDTRLTNSERWLPNYYIYRTTLTHDTHMYMICMQSIATCMCKLLWFFLYRWWPVCLSYLSH